GDELARRDGYSSRGLAGSLSRAVDRGTCLPADYGSVPLAEVREFHAAGSHFSVCSVRPALQRDPTPSPLHWPFATAARAWPVQRDDFSRRVRSTDGSFRLGAWRGVARVFPRAALPSGN